MPVSFANERCGGVANLTAPAKNSRPKGRFFCILGRLMRTHEKVVRPQTKGRRQYAGERKRMSAVAAEPILLPLPLKMKALKSVFFSLYIKHLAESM